ncbi:MAG: type II toxin-antitoxin system VapC family toxin [Pseudomonadales bacterium]
MIVLDTNVLSETLRPAPAPEVMAWLASQRSSALFTTTITRAELLYGVQLLPDGQRKDSFLSAIQGIFDHDLAGQVLSFDSAAADVFARFAASRKLAGRPISQFDAMIAAIAVSRGATLATRDSKDFNDCGVELINPWVFAGN